MNICGCPGQMYTVPLGVKVAVQAMYSQYKFEEFVCILYCYTVSLELTGNCNDYYSKTVFHRNDSNIILTMQNHYALYPLKVP